MIKVLFICHGNICRSPMAEYLFRDMVEKRGLSAQYCIRRNESRGNRQRSLSPGKTQVGICRHFLQYAPRKAGNEGGLCRL